LARFCWRACLTVRKFAPFYETFILPRLLSKIQRAIFRDYLSVTALSQANGLK